MTNELHQLARRIPDDLAELERVLNRVYDGWKVGKHSPDDYHLDSVAFNLHGFYSGLERIFERIAATVDGFKPKEKNWHKALLQQVSNEVPGVRPAVISQETREHLEEYLGFRHIVRNVYVVNFDPNRIENLVIKADPLFSQIREELLAFAKFLDEQGETGT